MDDEGNKEITREDANQMLELWAECLELDTESRMFHNLREELRFPVMKKRLTFDEDSEVFKLNLLRPIKADGHEVIQLVEISECTINAKKSLERFKESESIQSSMMMLTKYTNLKYQQVEQLKDRDINRINAVILGFLSHTPQLRD